MINRDEFIEKCKEIIAAIRDYKLDVDYINPHIIQQAYYYEGYGACVATYPKRLYEKLDRDINDLVIIVEDFDEDDVPDECVSDIEEFFLYTYDWYASILLVNIMDQKKSKSQLLLIKRALSKMARELYKDFFGKKLTQKAYDVCLFGDYTVFKVEFT